MPEFFRETQSIQKNWRVLNNDLRIVLDKIPFDLEPEVFEQKCNEIIKTKIFPDSDYNIANIFGFESKTIHQFVGENFDKISSDNPDFFKLSKIHLLFDKDGKKSTFLAFSNCDKKVYDDLSLTGMPSQLTFKRPRFFFKHR
ncbi:MAG: hypothetical protein FJX30_00555 [Alphaproteobacteria bacterium]|nr:hypothetical protein [Alphaproteobacteria bacterium]